MIDDVDVIVIGAGGGGPVVAKELGEKGVKVLLLEAGPWYGNNQWPKPNQEKGAISCSSSKNLSSTILDQCFSDLESDMNDLLSGKFRWGPANRNLSPWTRKTSKGGFVWQSAGVGGSTLHYFANSPRAFPLRVDHVWPISYRELIPYYEKVEATLPVSSAPVTPKEELFFYGAKKARFSRINTKDVTKPGYRPQPNAILPPNPAINSPDFKLDHQTTGCTLRGHCVNGCHVGPTVEKTAKRSTLVSYIPLGLKTGNVTIRPNTFVIKILTEKDVCGKLRVIGVRYRDVWTGEKGELRSKIVVMAAGTIESPRLWLNSKLPYNPWVGRGLTNHWFDCVYGIFPENVLTNILDISEVKPFVGQVSGARLDYPGLGVLQEFGTSPGIYSTLLYSLSEKGYKVLQKEKKGHFNSTGRVVGQELKDNMMNYTRTLGILIFTDDEVNQKNSVTLDRLLRDHHGKIPSIKYKPGKKDKFKRDKLAYIAADILKSAGAKKIGRTNCTSNLFVHIESTMRIGHVTDFNCEALQVKRLYIADNSVHYNSLGGPNPTLTTQALATRTAEKIVNKYFS